MSRKVSALREKPRRGQPSKFDKALQAQLTALACSPAPDGHCRWTLPLLADKLVELRWLDSISHQALAEALKKTPRSASAPALAEKAMVHRSDQWGLLGQYGRSTGRI